MKGHLGPLLLLEEVLLSQLGQGLLLPLLHSPKQNIRHSMA